MGQRGRFWKVVNVYTIVFISIQRLTTCTSLRSKRKLKTNNFVSFLQMLLISFVSIARDSKKYMDKGK